MTMVGPGGAGCRCSRGSAWASPLVPRDALLLERLQSRVPSWDLQAPRWCFCVLVVSREQEALAGQNGIPESQIPPPGSGVSEVHREAAPRPPPHLHHHDMKCATSARTAPKCSLNFPRKRLPRNTHPCGAQWERPRLGESRVLRSSGAIPGYDLSGVSFRKKQRVWTLGFALVPTTDLLNPAGGLFIWPFFVSAFPRLFFLLTL